MGKRALPLDLVSAEERNERDGMYRWIISAFGGLENEAGRTNLNLLKFFDEMLGHSWQKRVTVVKTWQYKGFRSLNREDMSNWLILCSSR